MHGVARARRGLTAQAPMSIATITGFEQMDRAARHRVVGARTDPSGRASVTCRRSEGRGRATAEDRRRTRRAAPGRRPRSYQRNDADAARARSAGGSPTASYGHDRQSAARSAARSNRRTSDDVGRSRRRRAPTPTARCAATANAVRAGARRRPCSCSTPRRAGASPPGTSGTAPRAPPAKHVTGGPAAR